MGTTLLELWPAVAVLIVSLLAIPSGRFRTAYILLTVTAIVAAVAGPVLRRRADATDRKESNDTIAALTGEVADVKRLASAIHAAHQVRVLTATAEGVARSGGTAVPTLFGPRDQSVETQAEHLANELDDWLTRQEREVPSLDASAADWEAQARRYLAFVRQARDDYRSRFEVRVRGIIALLRERDSTGLQQVYEDPPGFPAIHQVADQLRGVVVTPAPAVAVADVAGPTVLIGGKPVN